MVSIRGRLFLRLIELQRSPFEPGMCIEDQRSRLKELTARLPMPDGVSIESLRVSGRPAEWLLPLGARENRAVLYLHGGGYCLGSADTHRGLAARMAAASRTPVLLLDYRLAPEHPFPAALDDALAAVAWLTEQGIPPTNVAIAGDSAGGGLTLATALRLRDEGRPLPGVLVCLSPWTDLSASGAYAGPAAHSDPILSPETGATYAKVYRGETDDDSPLVSPVFADLSGLPPLLIQAAGREALLDDSARLAEAARRDGVDVDFEVWPGMWHVWQMTPQVPEARRALARIGAFIDLRLGAGCPASG